MLRNDNDWDTSGSFLAGFDSGFDRGFKLAMKLIQAPPAKPDVLPAEVIYWVMIVAAGTAIAVLGILRFLGHRF